MRSPSGEELARLLIARGATVRPQPSGILQVTGVDSAVVGELAASAGLVLHELTPHRASLEEAFMALTRDSVEFGARAGPADAGAVSGLPRWLAS